MTKTSILWMIWFETNPKAEPAHTLAEGMAYYAHKYGTTPNRALVPEGWPNLNGSTPPGLTIERARKVLPRHVWLIAQPEDQPSAEKQSPLPANLQKSLDEVL